jgi:hypothetical protein
MIGFAEASADEPDVAHLTQSRVAGTPVRGQTFEKRFVQQIAASKLRAMQEHNGARGMGSSKEHTRKSVWGRRNFLATSMVSTMSVSSFLDGRSGNTTPATLDLHAAYATTINVNGQR